MYGYNLIFFYARKTREFIWEPLNTKKKMRVKISCVTFDPFFTTMKYEVCFMNTCLPVHLFVFIIHLAHLKARVFCKVFMRLKSIYSDEMYLYIHT